MNGYKAQNYLTTEGFWQQGAQTNVRVPSTAVQYGMTPRIAAAALPGSPPMTNKYGILPFGNDQCVECVGNVCGGTNPKTGRPNPPVACSKPGQTYCYYNSMDECEGGLPKAAKAAVLSSEPFSKVIVTAYNQPNYYDALQTMFAGSI